MLPPRLETSPPEIGDVVNVFFLFGPAQPPKKKGWATIFDWIAGLISSSKHVHIFKGIARNEVGVSETIYGSGGPHST